MRAVFSLLAIIVAVAINIAVWAWPNRAVDTGNFSGPLQSVSFAAFHDGQSPLTRVYPSTAQIDRDLAVLVGNVAGIRTYTSLEGMQVVPKLAGRHGLKVIAGAWLSNRLPVNEQEIAALIDAANQYPATVTKVIVGNEVLLRGELKPAELAAYIRRVRQAVKQPVSYADVWEYWMQNPELAKDVDFITAHILPYWENDPVGVDHVGEHIEAVYRLLQERFPGKTILVGETGWPTAGRSRAAAVPGRVNKALFMHKFLELASAKGFDYNVIEAFDQPWKSALEGTVGANWGLFDSERHLKLRLDRPVVEDPQWFNHAGLAALIGLLPAALFFRRRPETWRLFGFVVLSQLLASLLIYAGWQGFAHSYSVTAGAWAAAKLVLQILLAVVLIGTASRMLVPIRPAAPAGLIDALVRDGSLAAIGQAVYLLQTLIALGLTAALVIDPRYRDFPTPDLLVPAYGMLAFKLFEWLDRRQAPLAFPRLFEAGVVASALPASWRRGSWIFALLAIAALATGAGVGWREGTINREAMFWVATLWVLTLPYAVGLFARRVAAPVP